MRSRAATISSRPTGQRDRSRSGIVGSLEVNVSGARLVIRHDDSPGAATDLAILDVLLRLAAARVDGDLVLLAAVRAHDGRAGVGGTVPQREVIDRVVAIASHDQKDVITSSSRQESGLGAPPDGGGLAIAHVDCRKREVAWIR